MKTTGVFILVIGLLFTIITTFGVLEERVTGGNLLTTIPHAMGTEIWQPLFGAIVVMIGVLIITSQRRGTSSLLR